MNIDPTSMAPPKLAERTAREAAAAQSAIEAEAKEENTRQIAELSDGVDEGHVAEHIRGMVAVTMAHPLINTSVTTREHAEQWQQWALGVADGVERGASPPNNPAIAAAARG